jgi:uncharacterized protein YwgA
MLIFSFAFQFILNIRKKRSKVQKMRFYLKTQKVGMNSLYHPKIFNTLYVNFITNILFVL